MKKCTIITYIEKEHLKLLESIDYDSFIICADIGLKYALESGITPSLVIADFDSFSEAVPDNITVERFPSKKDDSDTGLCVRYAIEHGFDTIEIIGGIGGRLDHTLANLQIMKGAKEKGIDITMKSYGNEVFILHNEMVSFKKRPGYISVLAAEEALGVFEKGTVYTLENATLTSSFPLGLSNEFKDDEAEISVRCGTVFVIFSIDVNS